MLKSRSSSVMGYMSKRRLSEKQKRHIQIKQDTLGNEEQGLVIAHYGKYIDIESKEGISYRCTLRQNLGTIVTGDQVFWRRGKDNTGIVFARLPRTTLLQRADAHHKLKLIAANIDQIIIVCALIPELNLLLLDSYLIAAENLKIKPIILINKIDLIEKLESNLIKIMAYYHELSYKIIKTSCKQEHGLDKLILQLQNHTSIFVGQSGVGKSSLINVLIPEAQLPVANLVEVLELGAHTTTTSRLFHLASGGDVIDSPGIREFTLSEKDPRVIESGFVEFIAHKENCKFYNCRHVNEPNCAIMSAVKEGKIAPSRYENYLKLISVHDKN